MTAKPSFRWTTITIDCADAEVLGRFYEQVFGWEITARDGTSWLQLRDPDGGVGVNIQAEDGYESPAGHPFCLFVDGE
jgi:predicted enzyme related to lactoylglutathione lyase